MKISLEWLGDYVETGLSPDQIGEILSSRGFPIESIEPVGGDTVLDVEITSNRGDMLGHIGVARELAAAIGKPLKLPELALDEADTDAETLIQVRIQEPALSNRYTARVIQGVKIGFSPDWMRRRLEAVGLRSINNIVDATNYVMMETGQPSHAFDYAKLGGRKIIVRKALNGERLVSIDGTQCKLDDSMLVIADAKIPVAIAGVMGGLDTEVSDATDTVLLETAHFEPVTIRSAARKLVLHSDASFRFERHVDAENIDWASARCAQLMARTSGGKIARGVVDCWPEKRQRNTIGLRFSRLVALLGIHIPKDTVLDIFAKLGLRPEVKNDDLVVCTPPTWRHDLSREADLIEEAARCYGYDKIPTEPKIHIQVAPANLREKTTCKVRNLLNGAGFYETINISFVDAKLAALFADQTPEQHLSVSDVCQKNTNLLRQNLIGSLAAVLQANYNVRNTPCRLFEIADTFIPDENHQPGKLPNEHTRIGLVLDDEFRTLRGVIEGLVREICLNSTLEFRPASFKWAEAGAQILLDGQPLGMAGMMNPDIAAQFNVEKQPVSAAELDFDLLLTKAGAIPAARPVPRFPAIVRDLSLIVDEPVAWSQIDSVVRSKAPAELEQIDFAGLYRGKPIPAGKKSITVSLRFRDEQGTLRHETVDGFQDAILAGLTESLGAELRTA